MKSSVLTKAVQSSADPERAKHFFDLLSQTDAWKAFGKISAAQAGVLAALFGGSQFLGNLLVSHPEWLTLLEIGRLNFPRREQGLRAEVQGWLKGFLNTRDYASAFGRIREFKQREMLRVAARDLANLSNVPEITREISDVADVCLEAVLQICQRQLTERIGEPWHRDVEGRWRRTEFCVLGMGKLGAQELNYSSDVDVLFLYSEEGEVFRERPGSAGVPPASSRTPRRRDGPRGRQGAPRAVMSNHQFFNRLAEAFIAEVSRVSADGMLYRIDLRLRPEGDSGPLCRSLGSYENYYAQWGQTWERMMLIKARCVAGDGALAAEFLETVQPFRYPRAINENVLHEIGAMKDRIEREIVRADELQRNVKLGRGGIREIEFIAQSQQLLHAGKMPFLQGAQTLPALEKLARYNLVSGEDVRSLRDAYHFLRDVEHRLQMEENLQTHTIPTNRASRERLARLMEFKSIAEFENVRRAQTESVRSIFDKSFKPEKSRTLEEQLPQEFAGAEREWQKLLADHSFREPDKIVHLLREFVEGPGYVHVSSRTIELARQLVPRLLAMCPRQGGRKGVKGGRDAHPTLSDPDRVVTRLDSFIAAYGARSTLFELWNVTLSIFDLLILLFDRSEFLAELAIRTPDMVDVLVTSGRLRQRKTSVETLRDLRHGLTDADQKVWLRRYHQTELMRIGLRDILGLVDPEQYRSELSALADACLQYAVDVIMRKHRMKAPPFVIIGLGKLGGAEIDYGSDLDIFFVTDTAAKNLPRLARLALELMELISARTELGIVFHTDARLRPDGEKGLLVNTLKGYESYYRERAQLWEIQSLTRTRPIAGDLKLGARFQSMIAKLVDLSTKVDWKNKIHEMRTRIEKERTPAGKDGLAIKTGSGGLMDAEFIAQTLCLANGWHEPNTLRALERGRDAGVLPEAGRLIENYRHLRRVEGVLRRWSYEGETVLPDEPEPFYRVSVRCGFATPEEFREALGSWRRNIREVYEKVFAGRVKGPSGNSKRVAKKNSSRAKRA